MQYSRRSAGSVRQPPPEPEQISNQSIDPLAPSYPESAGKYIGYRVAIVLFALVFIGIGKSSLPADGVRCIEDSVIDAFIPFTNYYQKNQFVGRILTTVCQLFVEGQLIGMGIFWYLRGKDLVYPVSLGLLGLAKITLNLIFKVEPIYPSFMFPVFPSLTFSNNMAANYFFSVPAAFLIMTMLQLHRTLRNHHSSFKRSLWKLQLLIIVYVFFVLISMRLNYIIDLLTGLVFGHLAYTKILGKREWIQEKAFQVYGTFAGDSPEESEAERDKPSK